MDSTDNPAYTTSLFLALFGSLVLCMLSLSIQKLTNNPILSTSFLCYWDVPRYGYDTVRLLKFLHPMLLLVLWFSW